MYYDEAIFLNGAVQMVSSGQEPAFAHDPWSWPTVFGRRWPIMVKPYVGPMKAYLAVLPFAIFGPNYFTARILAALLGAFSMWGFSVLIRDQFDLQTAAIVSWVLAIHPAYLVLTLYQGAVAEWMVPAAALSIALARYLRAPAADREFRLAARVTAAGGRNCARETPVDSVVSIGRAAGGCSNWRGAVPLVSNPIAGRHFRLHAVIESPEADARSGRGPAAYALPDSAFRRRTSCHMERPRVAAVAGNPFLIGGGPRG
jgi:hypothetical protein